MSIASGPWPEFGVVLQRDGQLRVVEDSELDAAVNGSDVEAVLTTGRYAEGFFPAGMVLAVRDRDAPRIEALLTKWRAEAPAHQATPKPAERSVTSRVVVGRWMTMGGRAVGVAAKAHEDALKMNEALTSKP